MNRIILLAVLMFSGSALADGCDYVEGTWRIDRYDENLQSQLEVEIVFAEDGELRAVSHANNGADSFYYVDWGTWSCENDVVEVAYAEYAHGLESEGIVYLELQEANNSYLGFKEIRENDDMPSERHAIRVSEYSAIHSC